MITAPVREDCQTTPPPAAEPPPPRARADPSLRFTCSFCRLMLEVAAEQAGVRGPCPGCGEDIEAPARAARSLPNPIPISPRPPTEEEPIRKDASRPQGMEAPLPMPALGVPPPVPPAPAPNPPVPRQPPIPAQPTVNVGGATLEERLEWGVSPRERRRSRSRPGRSVDPTSPFSMRYRNRRELVLTIKALLAILATAAIALAVAFFTKKSILKPSGDGRPAEAVQPLLPS